MTMSEGLKCKSDDGKINLMNKGKCSECWLNANYDTWVDGKKPACSRTFDFIAVTRNSLLSSVPDMIAVSFMKTSFKMAKDKIISRARALNKPLFAQAYLFGSEFVDHPSGGYNSFTLTYPGWLTEAEFTKAKSLAEMCSSEKYVVQEDGNEKPDSTHTTNDEADFL